MKNKILPITFIVVLLLTSAGTVITRVDLRATQSELKSVVEELGSTKRDLVTTTVSLNTTKKELTTAVETITTTKGKLDSTEDRLNSTVRDLGITKGDLTAAVETITTTKAKLDSTAKELGITKEELTATKSELKGVKDELGSTKRDLVATAASLSTTIVELGITKDKLQSTAKELVSTKEVYQSVVKELETIKRDMVTLNQKITLIGNLETRINTLNSEIKALEVKRIALVPEIVKSVFYCTGSMDPKITCMDTAEYLTNFKPEDVTVGAVIGMRNPGTYGCGLSGYRVTHRVMAIKIEGGEYFYRTKGDNNSEDDGCWIPSKAVDGYMISLTKGSDSVMEGLLSYVWSLETKSKALDKGIEYYGSEINRVLSMYRAYCPGNFTCILPPGPYEIANNLFQQLESLRLNLYRMVNEYKTINKDITDKRNELQSLRCSRLKLC
ncbi:MAG: hypothetical protein Q7R34_14090 [Dehalococcoidia bacterium]|nr:hypothetical protein [Dehalococcoidia bacterium]